jgi:hypothetical protein
MQALDWLRARPVAAAALGGLLLGVVLGLAMPIKASAPDPAELAEWIDYGSADLVRVDEATFAAARDAGLLGRELNAGGSADAPGTVAWRLVGIITAPAPIALVLAEGGATPVEVRVGETLPDGGRILEITPRAARFERAGCEFERALYSAGDVAVDDGCTRD